MILEIPRPAYGTEKQEIARRFGVSRHTLYIAEKAGRLERTARVFRLTVRSVGTYNIPRATPPIPRCTWCGTALTKRQKAANCKYCSDSCASWAKWQQRKEARRCRPN